MHATADTVFQVLADPTRRALFERLAARELPVHALTEGAGISQPAISKHLRILKDAGLVRERRDGRRTHYRAEPAALAPLIDWTSRMTAFWHDRLDALEDTLDRME